MKKIKYSLLVFLALYYPISVLSGQGDISWMKSSKYGIFIHYQYRILLGYSGNRQPGYPEASQMTAEGWNQFVDQFEVKKFANQMAKAKMGWVMFCLDDHYFAWPCSPNSKFNQYSGYGPGEKCSNRDLIMEVADALNARGIKLIVYYAGLNGYQKKPKILAGLGDSFRGNVGDKGVPSNEVRKKRLEILKEYADRFGTKIAGWWFDGMEKDSYSDTDI